MNSSSKSWTLLIVLSFIWGSSFILMKLGMYTSEGYEIFSDTQVASIRMLIAGVVLLPLAFRAIKKLNSWRQLALLCIVGYAGNFIPAFLFTYAETGISSGFTGMLNSFTPIFAILIGFIIFKNALSNFQIIGVAIGTVGVVFLTLSGGKISSNGTWMHPSAVILATLCYAISLNTIKHTLQHLRSTEITALSFMLTIPVSIGIFFSSDASHAIQSSEHATQGLIYIAILSIVGTAFAVILFNQLISSSSVLFASSVTYLIPIVALLIGIVFRESINSGQILSMLVILLGIFVANILPKIKASKQKSSN